MNQAQGKTLENDLQYSRSGLLHNLSRSSSAGSLDEMQAGLGLAGCLLLNLSKPVEDVLQVASPIITIKR